VNRARRFLVAITLAALITGANTIGVLPATPSVVYGTNGGTLIALSTAGARQWMVSLGQPIVGIAGAYDVVISEASNGTIFGNRGTQSGRSEFRHHRQGQEGLCLTQSEVAANSEGSRHEAPGLSCATLSHFSIAVLMAVARQLCNPLGLSRSWWSARRRPAVAGTRRRSPKFRPR